jgi:hypothetical protein
MSRAVRLAELRRLQEEEYEELTSKVKDCRVNLAKAQKRLAKRRRHREKRSKKSKSRKSPVAQRRATPPRIAEIPAPLPKKQVRFAESPKVSKPAKKSPPKKAIAPDQGSPLQPVPKLLAVTPKRGCLGNWAPLLPRGYRMTFRDNPAHSASDNKRIVAPDGTQYRSFKALGDQTGLTLYCVNAPWARRQQDGQGHSLLREKSWTQQKKDGTVATTTTSWVNDSAELRKALRSGALSSKGVSLPVAAATKA